MKLNKYYFRYIIVIMLCNTLVFATSEQLMLPEAKNSSEQIAKYHGEKEEQKYRCNEKFPFDRVDLRFVSSTSTLSVGYGVLPDSGIEIPKLALSDSRYEELKKLGMFVKIFLGYLKESDKSDSLSFTPEATNVLVPYVSSIIQWRAGIPPELVPTGFLRRQQNTPIIVLLSGNQGKEYQEKISKFYNHIYNDSSADERIDILSADDIADINIPYLLKGMVDARKAEPFKFSYLGEIIIENKLMETFCYIESANSDTQKAQNAIYVTLEFLKFLIQDQNCIDRYDTVSRLNDYLKGKIDKFPSKEEETDFNKYVQKYKDKLMNVAFKRMDDQIKKLPLLEDKFTKWKSYLTYCLYPSSHLDTIEKTESFWTLIQTIGDELQFSNPDGGDSISIVKRLYKVCFPSANRGNHTELLLMGLLKATPQSLIGNLREQFERKKNDKKPLVVEAGFPRYLGVVVDSFSWLDVCNSCARFLHTTPIWDSTLQDVRHFIEEAGFTIPFPKIDSLFRFISQDYYGEEPPLDLRDAKGGSNYRKSGWDFRLLSEERICLATRSDMKDTLIRDRIIEGIQNRLADVISSHESLRFFTEPWLWSILDMDRPFCKNALRILQAYHPENIALRIKLAQKIIHDPRGYHLLKPILNISNEIIKQQEYVNIFLSEDIKQCPQGYARVFFGYACISKIEEAAKSKPIQNISTFIIDFARYCRIYESPDCIQPITTTEMTVEDAITSITHHWKKKWSNGKKTSGYNFNNYEDYDKRITGSMISTLQSISNLDQEGLFSVEQQDLCGALKILAL